MVSRDIQQGKIVAGNDQLTREKVVDLTPMEIFYSYSHRDEALQNELEKHLSLLKWQGYIMQGYIMMVQPH